MIACTKHLPNSFSSPPSLLGNVFPTPTKGREPPFLKHIACYQLLNKHLKTQQHVSTILILIIIIILQLSHLNTTPFLSLHHQPQPKAIVCATRTLPLRINGHSRLARSDQETRRFVPRIRWPLHFSTRNDSSPKKRKLFWFISSSVCYAIHCGGGVVG